jgi:hypothetical protein
MRISLRGIESGKDTFEQQKSANCIEKFTTEDSKRELPQRIQTCIDEILL